MGTTAISGGVYIMADITPNDIVNIKFRQGFRGYDSDQVDDFLQQVSDTLYRVLEDNQRMRAQVDDLKGRVQHYQETEDLIKNALVLAERTAEELRERAKQDADAIRRQAEEQLRMEYQRLEQLRQLRLRVIAEVRGVLSTHLSLLDAQEERGAGVVELEGA
jgi:cell division initiation protein